MNYRLTWRYHPLGKYSQQELDAMQYHFLMALDFFIEIPKAHTMVFSALYAKHPEQYYKWMYHNWHLVQEYREVRKSFDKVSWKRLIKIKNPKALARLKRFKQLYRAAYKLHPPVHAYKDRGKRW
jgi:hypothetical protein